MNPLGMIRADLAAMRWTSVVTVVLIGLAVAIGIAIGAQERALRKATARAADDFPVLIGAPGSPTQLVLTSVYLQPEALTLMDGDILARLSADPRVGASAPIAFGDVVRGYPVVGTTADFASRWGRLKPTEGRAFAREGEAVVGADVALAIGAEVTPAHDIAGARHVHGEEGEEEHAHRHEGHSYRVVGRLPRFGSPWDRAILVPIESVWETHGLGNGHAEGADGERIGPPFDAVKVPGVPAVVVKPRQVFEAYALRSDYRKAGLMALFPAEVLVSLYQTVGDIRSILVVASVLNDVLVFLAILMLLVTLVGSRRRRYAVLRALGAGRAYIAAVVWGGAAVLLGLGSLAGLGFGWIGARVVSAIIAGRSGLALSVDLSGGEVALAFGMVGLGAVLAFLPALVMSRGDVARGLRG